ncbi:MAG: hypothetical protein WCR59_00950 [Planctomycetota bacterium]
MRRDLRTLGPRLAVLLAGIALACGLFHSVHGWPDLTTHLRDDAYYEFTWAYNLAHGNGPVVSDGTTTSGVQYLWSLMLSLFARLGDGSALPDIAVVLGVLCHILAAVSFWRAGRRTAGALCVALLWLGNPLLLRECQNGQETALACLCAVLLWHSRRSREVTFLLWALLSVLARSDLFFVVVLLSLVRHRATWWRGLTTPLLVLLCHLGLNRVLGGSFLQDSGLPMAWLRHANFAALSPTSSQWLQQAWWYGRPALLGGPYELATAWGVGVALFACVRRFFPRRLRLLPLFVVAIACLLGMSNLLVLWVCAALIAVLPVRRKRHVPLMLSALGLGLAFVIVLHWAIRWYPRDYYAALLVVFACAGLMHWRRFWQLLLVVGVLSAVVADRIPLEPLQGQKRMQIAGDFVAEIAPPEERIGCFNSGYITFAQRLHGPRIVNLDGVVDARSFAALQRGELGAWLDREHISLLLDAPVQFSNDPNLPHASGRFIAPDFMLARDCVELARFVVPGLSPLLGGDCMILYWRRSAGTAPQMFSSVRLLGRCGDCQVIAWPAKQGADLAAELADGTRLLVATAPVDTVCVIGLPVARFYSARLFVRGADLPLLQLPAERR